MGYFSLAQANKNVKKLKKCKNVKNMPVINSAGSLQHLLQKKS